MAKDTRPFDNGAVLRIGILCTAAILVVLLKLLVEAVMDPESSQDRSLRLVASRLRPIATAGPIRELLEKVRGDRQQAEILQCDDGPTIRVGNLPGYRMLMLEHYRTFIRWTDIVLFSETAPNPLHIKKQIDWEALPGEIDLRTVYMGKGRGYHWFGHMSIAGTERLRDEFALTGGEDRFELFTRCLEETTREQNREYLLNALASFNDKALPTIDREIQRAKGGCSFAAIRALKAHPSPHNLELLMSYYDKPATKHAVMTALAGKPFLSEGKRAYLEMLDSDSLHFLFWPAVEASEQFGWIEAIPALERANKRAEDAWDYVKCRKVIRALQGNPCPETLARAIEELSRSCRSTKDTSEIVRSEIEAIVNSPDTEAAILEGMRMAMAPWVKGSDMRSVNAMGVELLRGLPREQVLQALREMKDSFRSDSWAIQSTGRLIHAIETGTGYKR